MEAAEAWQVRPTVFMHEWPDRDRELAKALILHRRGDCSGCGYPKSEVWVDAADAEHDYIAEEVQCLTCARLQSAQEGEKTQKGLHYFIERRPKRASGEALHGTNDERNQPDDE